MFTSPMIPASSKTALLTRVRLGAKKMENSCSTFPLFCRRLICSRVEMSAHPDGTQSEIAGKGPNEMSL